MEVIVLALLTAFLVVMSYFVSKNESDARKHSDDIDDDIREAYREGFRQGVGMKWGSDPQELDELPKKTKSIKKRRS